MLKAGPILLVPSANMIISLVDFSNWGTSGGPQNMLRFGLFPVTDNSQLLMQSGNVDGTP